MITGRISKAAIQAKAQVIDSNSDWFCPRSGVRLT
jgi:hypothetical protein